MDHQEPLDEAPRPAAPGFGPPPPGYGPVTPPPAPPVSAAPYGYPAPPPIAAPYQPTAPTAPVPAPAEARPSRRGLLTGLVAGGLVAVGAGTVFALNGSKPKPSPQPVPPNGTASPSASGSAAASASASTGRAPGQPPQPIWTFEAPGQMQPYLAVAGGTLLVVGSELTALDAATGRQKWDFRKLNPALVGPGVSPIALGRAQVVLNTGDIFNPALTCLDLATGGTVWDTTAPPTLVVSQFLGYNDKTLFVLASRAPNGGKWADMPGGTVGDPVVAALDCVNHKILWALPRQKGAKDSLPLLITDTRFIYTDDKGSLVVRDITSGQQLWSAGGSTSKTAVSGHPVIVGDTVYVGDPDAPGQGRDLTPGYLRAFDLATGAPKYQNQSWTKLLVPEPATADGRLYVWNASGLAEVDPATGAARWTTKGDPSATVSNYGMKIAGPTIFTWPEPHDSPTVNALDRATGAARWTYRSNLTTSYASNWSAAAGNDRLYLALDSHVLALPAV